MTHDEHDDSEERADSGSGSDTSDPTGSDAGESDDDGGDHDSDDLKEMSAPWKSDSKTMRRLRNLATDGVLTVHYTTRDVPLAIGGEMAMRLIATWQHRPRFLEQIDAQWADATLGWLGVDLSQILGFTWEPRPLGDDATNRLSRMTVDPVR